MKESYTQVERKGGRVNLPLSSALPIACATPTERLTARHIGHVTLSAQLAPTRTWLAHSFFSTPQVRPLYPTAP